MLEKLGVLRPDLASAMGKLRAIPTDIEPIFITADTIAPEAKPTRSGVSRDAEVKR